MITTSSNLSIKRVLNLSVGFEPLEQCESLRYSTKKFPGGEHYLKLEESNWEKLASDKSLCITTRLSSSDDILLLMNAVDAARRIDYSSISLVCPYIPGGRQDRVCNEGEPFTLKIIADLLNSLNFIKVYTLSPHSDVTPALINNCELLNLDVSFLVDIINQHFEFVNDNKNINIVCPDAGARKRVEKIGQQLSTILDNFNFYIIGCEKIRDVKDGSLKDFFVNADDLHKRSSIVVDDVCAYGGTFVGLSEKLKEKNCGNLYLYVSHYDSNAGLVNVSNHFDKVFTTNSKDDKDENIILNKNIKIFDIKLGLGEGFSF